MQQPLFKTEFGNLPLRIPEPWIDFFDRMAVQLGTSRNSAVCLAIKIGGPILQQHVSAMREQLRAECERLARHKAVSTILGVPPAPPLAVPGEHDRRQSDPSSHSGNSGKSQSSQGGH